MLPGQRTLDGSKLSHPVTSPNLRATSVCPDREALAWPFPSRPSGPGCMAAWGPGACLKPLYWFPQCTEVSKHLLCVSMGQLLERQGLESQRRMEVRSEMPGRKGQVALVARWGQSKPASLCHKSIMPGTGISTLGLFTYLVFPTS